MNELFYRPSSLFSTEAVLIEALRKRSDREISKRDELIAEYQKRLALRDAAQRSLEPSPGPAAREAGPDSRRSLAAAPETPSAPEPPASDEAEARLRSLGETAALDALDAQRLARGLEGVAELLGAGDLQGAQDRVDSLGRDPMLRDRPDSRIVLASLGLLRSLSAGISGLRRAGEEATEPRAADRATLERLRSELDGLGGRLVAAREEASALRSSLAEAGAERDRSAAELAAARTALANLEISNDRLRNRLVPAEPPAPLEPQPEAPGDGGLPVLAGRPAGIAPMDAGISASAGPAPTTEPPPAPAPAAAAQLPRGAFIGSVAAELGGTLLVDLAEGARVQVGQAVAVYSRVGTSFALRGSGRVVSTRRETATVSLDPSGPAAPSPALGDGRGPGTEGAPDSGDSPRIGLQDPVFLLP